MFSKNVSDFNQSYHNLKKEITDWPKQHELQAAVRSFLRLRTTYYLDISKVIQGNINEEKTEPLSLSLIQLIIKEAEYIKMWDEALLWSDALLDLLPELTSTNISTTAMFIDQIKARILHKVSITGNIIMYTSVLITIFEKYFYCFRLTKNNPHFLFLIPRRNYIQKDKPLG